MRKMTCYTLMSAKTLTVSTNIYYTLKKYIKKTNENEDYIYKHYYICKCKVIMKIQTQCIRIKFFFIGCEVVSSSDRSVRWGPRCLAVRIRTRTWTLKGTRDSPVGSMVCLIRPVRRPRVSVWHDQRGPESRVFEKNRSNGCGRNDTT